MIGSATYPRSRAHGSATRPRQIESAKAFPSTMDLGVAPMFDSGPQSSVNPLPHFGHLYNGVLSSTLLFWGCKEHSVEQAFFLAVTGVEGGQGVGEAKEVRAALGLGLEHRAQRIRLAARLKQHRDVHAVQRRGSGR